MNMIIENLAITLYGVLDSIKLHSNKILLLNFIEYHEVCLSFREILVRVLKILRKMTDIDKKATFIILNNCS